MYDQALDRKFYYVKLRSVDSKWRKLMGSRRYPGRRPLKGWQLTALVGVVGALGVSRLQQ